MNPLFLFPSEEPSIFTVSMLNTRIKELIEAGFSSVWVTGEISNLRSPSSGHCYFTLKDEQSQIRAVMFRTQQRALRFAPESGMQVLCQGYCTVYEPRGEYQVIVVSMEPKGAGAMQIAFEQLKKKLEAEGLCDPAKKSPMPACPQGIGIVTSATGAAIRDILKVFQRSPSPLAVTVFPVRVQGQEAAGEIAKAIRDANTHADALGLDCLIVGRGGGSIEDLWSFNEEVVARAIAASRLPVISAVGHEIDFTISDAVADMRAPTPTAAAEWIVATLERLHREVGKHRDRVLEAALRQVRLLGQRAALLGKRLISPLRQIENRRIFLDERTERLQQAMLRIIERARSVCARYEERLLFSSPLKSIERGRAVTDLLRRDLALHYNNLLDKQRYRLQKYASQLDGLSPLAVLGRGYSITYLLPSKKVIRKAEEAAPGDKVRIRLHEGSLLCVVQKTIEEPALLAGGKGPREQKEE